MLASDYQRLHLPIVFDRLINTKVESRLAKYSYIFFLVILTFPYLDFAHVPSAGIDSSWRIALEIIQEKKLVWGNDVIYTYGPLGHWLQRYVITTGRLELLLVDLFFTISLAISLYSFLPNPLKIWHLCLFFTIWAVVNSMYGEWIHFMWFYWVIYWGIRYLHQPNKVLLYYVFILCTINFFMKANYGIVALGFMFSLLSYIYLAKQESITWCLTHIAILIIFLVIGAYRLHTDLINYFISSLHVITGYNESQAIYPDHRLRIVLASYGFYLLQAIVVMVYFHKTITSTYKLKAHQFNALFSLFWLLIISFILLKYSFTRADDGHLTIFIKQSSLMLLLIIASVKEDWLRKRFFYLLLLNCSIYLAFYVPVFGKIQVNYINVFSNKVQIVGHYFQTAFTHNYPTPKTTIPKHIRQKIGNQSADVLPNEISEIYFNGINYNPRPVIQSYQAYNLYLDTKTGKNTYPGQLPNGLYIITPV